MAINSIGNIDSNPILVDSNRRKSEAKQDAAAHAAHPQSDAGQNQANAVSITPIAETMLAAEKRAHEHPVVDRAKVEEIRQKLANGEFEINPEQLAEKMIALDMFVETKLGR